MVLREGADVPVFGGGGVALGDPPAVGGAVGLVGHLPDDVVVTVLGEGHEDALEGYLACLDFVAIGFDTFCKDVGHTLLVAFGYEAVVEGHGLFALTSATTCDAGIDGGLSIVELRVEGTLDVVGQAGVGVDVGACAELVSHLGHDSGEVVVGASLGELGRHHGTDACGFLSPVAEHAVGVVDEVAGGIVGKVRHQAFHLLIVLLDERGIAVVTPVAVRHEDGCAAPVRVVFIDAHVEGCDRRNLTVGLLGIEAVADDFLIEVLHVEVAVERDVHLVGHVEPAEFLTLRTVGDGVVELRGDGVAADDVNLVDERV